jgi:hypothetical protein
MTATPDRGKLPLMLRWLRRKYWNVRFWWGSDQIAIGGTHPSVKKHRRG